MKTRLFFARAMALALVAGGIVASLPTEAMAANRTWTNGSSGPSGNKLKWGTTAQFATNWSSVGVATFANPTSADTAVFSGTNTSTHNIAIQSANVPIGKLTFTSGTTAYSFTSQPLAISGDGSIPNLGISNASGKTQTFSAVTVAAPTLHANSTGAGSTLALTSVDLQGNYFAVGGDATVTGLTGSAGSTYEVKANSTQTVNFSNGNAVGSLKVNGTVTTTGDSNGTFLDIQGGTYVGGSTFKNVSITSGELDLSGFNSLVLTDTTGATYNQGAGGFTKMDVGYDGVDATFSLVSTAPGSGFTLGGALLLDGLTMTGSPLPMGTTWNLFQGVNFTNGSASPANDASNFSQLVLADSASGSPYAGTFTRFGQEWSSPRATDGTYLVFSAETGNLVVVPEPSTIVFAGLGVAMSGWTMWKKRRLSKLLAAKAG